MWFDLTSVGRPVTDVTDVTLLAEKSRMKKKIEYGKGHVPSCVLEKEHHSPP